MQEFERSFAQFADWLDSVVWSVPLFFLLLGCGLLFSVFTKLIQRRSLTHGIRCIQGKYDNPGDTGHISHFQALCAALSATIGLGNIAGVATAVSIGGPGAVFWMWIVGLFGMAIKFVECTLSVMYRDERDVPDPSAPALMEKDAEARTLEYKGESPPKPGAKEMARGEVRGGPMWYIQKALVEPLRAQGNPAWVLFKVLAVVYALVVAVCSFGSGNMYQAWNVGNTLSREGVPETITGVVVAFLVSLVIIGGIKRIGAVASKLVPFMCVVYVLGALAVLLQNASDIPAMFALIFKSAFSQTAGGGAFAGIGVYAAFKIGLQRALFSNEAGQGSAAIAHAAAKTEEPIREGVVASIGPFIDTIVICTMTALVILSTGTWTRPAVGTVTGVENQVVEGQTITAIDMALTPFADVPANLRAPHYADLANPSGELWVLIEREQGSESKRLAATAKGLANLSAEEIGKLSTCRITLTRQSEAKDPAAFAADVAKIEKGMPVHLALDGAQITRFAMDTLGVGIGRWIIVVGVCLFAFSTMISWSYYGEKGTEFLLGPGAILPYKILFVIAIFMGCVIQHFETVYNFADAMVGLTVFCNLPACLLLFPTLLRASRHYFKRLDKGQMPRTK